MLIHAVSLIGFIVSLFVIGSFLDWNGCPEGWSCTGILFFGPNSLLAPELVVTSLSILVIVLITGELIVFSHIRKIFSKENR